METLNYLENAGKKFASFSLKEYLKESETDYVIYNIDYKNKELIWLEGVKNESVSSEVRGHFNWGGQIKAAYKGFNDKDIHPREINIFLVNPALLVQSLDNEFEIILFHEIIHLLQLTGYYRELNIEFTEEDERVGKIINAGAQEVHERLYGFGEDEYHNLLFGKLLNNFFEKHDREGKSQLIATALKYTIPDFEV